jgi:hypothetical protein
MQLMALIAWRHEHGRLPDRLEDLVGTYLNHLPLDPLTGKQFVLVTTMDDLKQLLPDVQWPSESTPTEKPLLPALFTPSSRMLGALRVDRPDGRGEVWLDFDLPFVVASDVTGFQPLPVHEE